MECVVVAMDESDESQAALKYAFGQFSNAEIHVIHVPETDNFTFDLDSTITEEAEKRAQAVLERANAIADRHGQDVKTELVFGNATKAIVTYADEHDMDQIVVGSKGHTGAKRVLLGSVAETVVRRANCPVTVVR